MHMCSAEPHNIARGLLTNSYKPCASSPSPSYRLAAAQCAEGCAALLAHISQGRLNASTATACIERRLALQGLVDVAGAGHWGTTGQHHGCRGLGRGGGSSSRGLGLLLLLCCRSRLGLSCRLGFGSRGGCFWLLCLGCRGGGCWGRGRSCCCICLADCQGTNCDGLADLDRGCLCNGEAKSRLANHSAQFSVGTACKQQGYTWW